MNIHDYWKACLAQDREGMAPYFRPDAYVNWHNTNEHFTVREFIAANCDYPGKWGGQIQRVETQGDLIITVVHVYSLEEDLSFHVTSFIRTDGDKIAAIDEYWGDDGPAPQWRIDQGLSSPIRRL